MSVTGPILLKKEVFECATASLIILDDKIADSFQGNVFIGIRGGLKRLEELNWEEIIDRPWEILSKQKSNQWIPGDQFLRVVKEKRPQNTEA